MTLKTNFYLLGCVRLCCCKW